MRKPALLLFLQLILLFNHTLTANAKLTLDEPTSKNVNNRIIEEMEQEAEIEQVRYKGIIPAPEVKLYGHDPNKTIGEKIKEGTVELNDVPFILLYLIDFFSTIAGTVTVIAILYAGILFLTSGLTEAKEQAKNTLFYAIIGLITTFALAWMLPAFIQIWITS
jgi:type IV secretion system pilin